MEETSEELFKKTLIADRDYLYKEFDKGLLYIPSAIFGVSFAFIEKIVKLSSATCGWVLVLSWALLGTAIFLAVITQYINYKLIEYQITNHSKRKEPEQSGHIKQKGKHIDCINKLTLVLDGFGTLGILLFILINFNVREAAGKDESAVTQKTTIINNIIYNCDSLAKKKPVVCAPSKKKVIQ